MNEVYNELYTEVDKERNALWKSCPTEAARGPREEKNKGAGPAPESRKYLGWNSLKEGTYFLPFFPFLVLFLAAFFLAGMWSVTSSWQI
jgi:hypothetical protein